MDPQLRDRLSRAAEGAFQDTRVLFAYVFGSVATGRTHRRSDLDVAIYVEPPIDSAQVLDLTLDLGTRFATASGEPNVDLLVLNTAPLRLQGRILRQRVIVYSRDEVARVRYESRTFREAGASTARSCAPPPKAAADG
jgi:uncharacterized protein